MPRLVNGVTRTEEVARAVTDVLAEGGIPALTVRAIADRVGLSPAALHVHYGSRERMLLVVACAFGRRRVEQIEVHAQHDGVAAFLPLDDDDLVDLRAWLGWLELARSATWLTTGLQDVLDRERDALSRTVAHRLAPPELDWLGAVVAGLAVAVCRPVRPMARDRARELLVGAARQLLPEDVPPAPPPYDSLAHRMNQQAAWGA